MVPVNIVYDTSVYCIPVDCFSVSLYMYNLVKRAVNDILFMKVGKIIQLQTDATHNI